jgi:radical SAM superfamily enzyme YgiQ (UPF0313 family)
MIRKKTDWNVLVYNADFVPDSELSISGTYSFATGFKNYLTNLSDLSGPIWREIKETIANYKPAVVGIHSCAASFVSASNVAKVAKDFNREVTVVVGGPHPTSVGKDVLKEPNIDIGVRGEGESTLIEILDAVVNRESFDKIRGISYRTGPDIVETLEGEYIEDLDSLSFPIEYAHEVLKDYDKYPKSAFRDVFTSRGCHYNCFFCGSRYVWGRKVRFRSVSNVVEEIKSLRKIGLKWIEFLDDTFGSDREYLHELCNSLIKERTGIFWSCGTRVNVIDKQTVILMRKAGCRSIDIGIESGNNEMLKKIRKGITVEEALAAADVITKHGIRLIANFIVGFPEETEQTMNDTFKAMKKIKGLLIYNIFTPYPGTEAFEFCRRKGLVGDDFDMSLYNHQSPENCFCLNIPKERFRELAFQIEKYVERHNARQDFRSFFSLDALSKVRDYGIRQSLGKMVSSLRSAQARSPN